MGFRSVVDQCETTLEVIDAPAMTVEQGRIAGDRLASLPPEIRPTAVFAANDLLALGVLNAMVHHGIAIPNEVSIVGYDDITFARTALVPLSSIEQPARSMGREGARLLYEELAASDAGEDFQPRRVAFTPRLIVRASSGPPQLP